MGCDLASRRTNEAPRSGSRLQLPLSKESQLMSTPKPQPISEVREALIVLSNRAVLGEAEILNCLYATREGHRLIAGNPEIAQFLREDALKRVVELDENERQLAALVQNIKSHLSHLYPAQLETQSENAAQSEQSES